MCPKRVGRGKLPPDVAVTCIMGGVNGWKPELTEWFRDKHVCMIPDHDKAGYDFTKKVAKHLEGVAASFQVRVWRDGTPEKWDIADVLEAFAPEAGQVIPAQPEAGAFDAVFPTELLDPPQPMEKIADKLSAKSISTTEAAKAPRANTASASRSSGGQVTSQEIAAAYVRQILQPDKRDLCFTCAEKYWKYSPSSGWLQEKISDLTPEIMRFVRKHIKAIGDPSDLTVHRQNSIMRNIQQMLSVFREDTAGDFEESLDPTMYLDFTDEGVNARPAPGTLACRSHMMHVESLARRLAAEERAGIAYDWSSSVTARILYPASSLLFTKGKIPCNFDPTATCPRWMRFLEEACPEDAEMLQMMFGLTLTYNQRYNVFFVIFGPGGSGKTTAMDMLKALNRGNYCAVSLGDFGGKFEEYPLTENRLNVVADMEIISKGEKSSRMEMVLKTIAGKEEKNTQQKYEDSQMRPMLAWNVFTTNHLPEFEETTSAIAQRMRLIRFPNEFRDTDRQDPNLRKELLTELPGILNWSLIGLGKLLECRTFPETADSKAQKDESIKAARPHVLFCQECLEKGDPSDFLTSAELMEAYNRYCDTNNYRRMSKNILTAAIREHFHLPGGSERSRVNGKEERGIFEIRFQPGVSHHDCYRTH